MDLNEIKKIIEEDGGKIIVIENGEPVMVVTSFDEYRKKKQTARKEPVEAIPEELNEDELKIEDLPF